MTGNKFALKKTISTSQPVKSVISYVYGSFNNLKMHPVLAVLLDFQVKDTSHSFQVIQIAKMVK